VFGGLPAPPVPILPYIPLDAAFRGKLQKSTKLTGQAERVANSILCSSLYVLFLFRGAVVAEPNAVHFFGGRAAAWFQPTAASVSEFGSWHHQFSFAQKQKGRCP
jgi:hypothetical protein